MELSERLQQLRKLANYSQEQLAEMLCISRQAISKWESGQSNPDINNIIKLSEIYNVSTDYILIGKENNSNQLEESNSKKKEYSQPFKIASVIIAIIAATAIVSVLFISTLGRIAGAW
ncbi:helix-turn-helix domain-containing protein [Clostridium sp. MSJ-11]|uniref:Helix-turn-helix domain-containing protein n=1 Tax=Clostridium mobile TaxID=2841512 RepID=A0ABS6EF57_9CLOT|nr:helix-turn-helix transcriptional regulator [Clostridium mobile]MBU5483777.1 helix-turn-helix domain-containing protein [Clostridium mobile]